VYESASPIQTSELTKYNSSCCSYEDNYIEHSQAVFLPLGVTFNQILMAGEIESGSVYGYTQLYVDNFPYIESCTSDTCRSTDTLIGQIDNGSTYYADAGDGAMYINVATTTVTQPRTYMLSSFTGSPTYTLDRSLQFEAGSYTFCSSGTYGSVSCTDTQKEKAMAFKLCMTECDSSVFSPVPNVTANPWVRLTAPASGSTQSSTVTLRIESNAGTSTADTITVRYLSNFQSIAPDVYSVNTSGIQPKIITKNFPAINDTVQIEISMSTGSTTVVTSPTYSIRISDSLINDEASTENQVNCDSTSGIGWAICSTAVLLFIPSDASINRFTDVYDTLSTKFPFAYLTDFRDSITSIYTGSTTASLGLTVPFGDVGDITLISADLVSDVPFTSTIRTILGALIWLMLAAQIWGRGQTIFNQKTT